MIATNQNAVFFVLVLKHKIRDLSSKVSVHDLLFSASVCSEKSENHYGKHMNVVNFIIRFITIVLLHLSLM